MKTKAMTERKAAEAEIKERFKCLQGTLTERSRRLFAGSEALAFGYGGYHGCQWCDLSIAKDGPSWA